MKNKENVFQYHVGQNIFLRQVLIFQVDALNSLIFIILSCSASKRQGKKEKINLKIESAFLGQKKY